jgi:integral membrane protein (TIGR00529 family)
MYSVVLVFATLAVIVVLLNRKVKLGYAMLAGSAIIFFAAAPTAAKLEAAVRATATGRATWEIVLALYFVMCLEFQLRTGGVIDGMMTAARRIFRSESFLLMLMPSFLGFLPSLGGAIFSAPLVENAAKPFDLSPERKTAINYWFRHVWEYSNPIFTGMLLASQLSGIPLGELVFHMAWATAVALLFGWLLLVAPLRPVTGAAVHTAGPGADRDSWRYIFLATGPIVANFALVVFFRLSAAVSMALVVAAMAVILRQNAAALRAMLNHALDGKLLWGVAGILFFQQILSQSGVIGEFTVLMNSLAVPAMTVVGVIALLGGLLTGTSQGFVAITFPFIALLSPGNLDLVMVCFVMGMAGQMLSPAHLCLLVTLDYFKADFLRSLRPIFLLEAALVATAYAVVSLWGNGGAGL